MSRRARGEGQIRHRTDGRWEGRFTTPDGRRRSVFADSKDDAATALRNATIARDRGTLAAPSRETVRSYLQTWLAGARPSLRPMTFQSYEAIIRNQLEPRLGRIRLTQLRPHHVQAMHTAMLTEGLSTKYGAQRSRRPAPGARARRPVAPDRRSIPRRRRPSPARTARDARAHAGPGARRPGGRRGSTSCARCGCSCSPPDCARASCSRSDGETSTSMAGRLAVTANSVRVTKRARDLLGITGAEPFVASRRRSAAGASWRCRHSPSMR